MSKKDNWPVAEAMLRLSRPEPASPIIITDHPAQIPPFSHPTTLTSTTISTIPRNLSQKPSESTSNSSLAPSLSPPPDPKPRSVTPDPELSRPFAMRLSQLVTPESSQAEPHLPSPLRLNPSNRPNPTLTNTPLVAAPLLVDPPAALPSSTLPRSQALQFPPLKLAVHSTPMPLTEPVTPPFSPPVLPPIVSVAGLTGTTVQRSGLTENRNAAVSSWNSHNSHLNVSTVEQMPAHGLGFRPVVSNVHTSLYTSQQLTQTGPHQTTVRTTTGMYAAPTTSNGMYRVSGSNRNHTTSSTNGPAKKVMKRPYKKYYSNPTPSSHCHVCARTSKAVKFAVCARIAEGLCRKVTCHKCFVKFGWDWTAAVDNPDWVCVHCRGECPEGRSQCFIYSRVNSKRESKRGAKKAAKLAATAEAAAAAAAAASASARKVQLMYRAENATGEGVQGQAGGVMGSSFVDRGGSLRQRVW